MISREHTEPSRVLGNELTDRKLGREVNDLGVDRLLKKAPQAIGLDQQIGQPTRVGQQ